MYQWSNISYFFNTGLILLQNLLSSLSLFKSIANNDYVTLCGVKYMKKNSFTLPQIWKVLIYENKYKIKFQLLLG